MTVPTPPVAPVTLFAGRIALLAPDGVPSAIHKQMCTEPVAIGPLGLSGDAQADRSVHGGPDKAVHFFPAEHYTRLADAFPQLANAFVAGSIGENISASGYCEETVRIGDQFLIGSARLQVTQARGPCWKIDHRYGAEGIAHRIAELGITGWYCRVITPGMAGSGDCLQQITSDGAAPTLAQLGTIWRQHRPDLEQLAWLAAAPGLAPAWRDKILRRLDWLKANPDAVAPAPTLFHVKP